MTLKDKAGRAYATVADTKASDKLEADGDFTCIEEGAVLTVKSVAGELCIECSAGNHGLDGQIRGGIYLGLYPARAS